VPSSTKAGGQESPCPSLPNLCSPGYTPFDAGPGATLGRSSFVKHFEGDLVADSTVEMLAAITEVRGSAAYVAIERIVGRLHGRQGSFVVYHRGLMDRGAQSLEIGIVPDAATGELAGIRGSMTIQIEDGKHFYRCDYQLPE
jgi:Protein of unknown function (DUF3224)